MSGRTLRQAISVALEPFPVSALHDPAMVEAIHSAVAEWMKDYAIRLGVKFDDGDGVLDDEIEHVIAVARTKTPLQR